FHTSPLITFLFNLTATTEIYTLSLHDALPIWRNTTLQFITEQRNPHLHRSRATLQNQIVNVNLPIAKPRHPLPILRGPPPRPKVDRKSTRLNSSHVAISYAVFCLKKKKKKHTK